MLKQLGTHCIPWYISIWPSILPRLRWFVLIFKYTFVFEFVYCLSCIEKIVYFPYTLHAQFSSANVLNYHCILSKLGYGHWYLTQDLRVVKKLLTSPHAILVCLNLTSSSDIPPSHICVPDVKFQICARFQLPANVHLRRPQVMIQILKSPTTQV